MFAWRKSSLLASAGRTCPDPFRHRTGNRPVLQATAMQKFKALPLPLRASKERRWRIEAASA
jgi:hypothetical protein